MILYDAVMEMKDMNINSNKCNYSHCLPYKLTVVVNAITIPTMTPFHLSVDVLGRELPLSL